MASDNCLFCAIASGDQQADVVHEDDDAVAFRDVDPQAPTHVLVIPRKHIRSIDDMADGDAALIGHLFAVGRDVARDEGVNASGYRLVINVGAAAGQSVDHVHLHVVGGRNMTWPPG